MFQERKQSCCFLPPFCKIHTIKKISFLPMIYNKFHKIGKHKGNPTYFCVPKKFFVFLKNIIYCLQKNMGTHLHRFWKLHILENCLCLIFFKRKVKIVWWYSKQFSLLFTNNCESQHS